MNLEGVRDRLLTDSWFDNWRQLARERLGMIPLDLSVVLWKVVYCNANSPGMLDGDGIGLRGAQCTVGK